VLGGGRTVVVEPDPASGGDRREQTELAVSRALGVPTQVRHRPDGKPEIDGASVSASHGAGVTLAVVGQGRLGCDVETVLERDRQTWDDLIGPDQVAVRDLLVADTGESEAVAGTRVWSALECLRKTGATSQALTVERVESNGWVVLSSGSSAIATWVTTLNDVPEPVVFAVLVGEEVQK
jgi:enediyne polyketide synthase